MGRLCGTFFLGYYYYLQVSITQSFRSIVLSLGTSLGSSDFEAQKGIRERHTAGECEQRLTQEKPKY